jgi:serine protease Do
VSPAHSARRFLQRALASLLGVALALPGSAAGQELGPPGSFAHVAAIARAATIVVRTPDIPGDPAGSFPDEGPDVGPLDEESETFGVLAERDERTLASGIVVDPRGFALTSARAVLLVERFEVVLADGKAVQATLLAVDWRTDVAVLKLDSGGPALAHVPFGDSRQVRAGDWVIAVSAPMGLEGTVTAGVVTATPSASPSALGAFLQTDAAVGSSQAGSPVVSLAGQLVGLTTLLSGGGVTYVRPSAIVRRVYLELLEKGEISRPWLGVTTQPVTPDLGRALGVGHEAGVLLADVDPEGPGAAAGLRPGDVLLALDGTPIASRAQLDRIVAERVPGRVVKLDVRRPSGPVRVSVRLGTEPDDWLVPPLLARARRLLGIEVRRITPTMGVSTLTVDPASPAGRAGLRAGDVIREIDRRPIRTLADFEAAMRSVEPRRPVLVHIQRGELAVYVALVPRDIGDF